MIVDSNFLRSFKYKLPFVLTRYEDKLYYVLNDKLYCQLFWMKFYSKIFAPRFQKQIMINTANGIDITMPVWITKDESKIIKLPKFVNSILYFSDILDRSSSLFVINVSSFVITVVGILLIIIVIFLSWIFNLPTIW